MQDSLSVQLDAGFSSMSTNSSNLALKDCNAFFSYEQTSLLPWAGEQILTLGITASLDVCVRNCNMSHEHKELIRLKGTIYGDTVKTTPPLPPPVRIGGELELVATDGHWHRAFGVPALHLGNVIAGASLNIAFYPPVPSTLILGGSACIGSEHHCKHKTEKRFIDGGAYVSIVSCELEIFVSLFSPQFRQDLSQSADSAFLISYQI